MRSRVVISEHCKDRTMFNTPVSTSLTCETIVDSLSPLSSDPHCPILYLREEAVSNEQRAVTFHDV
jgi:hypothetical protein